MMLDEASIDTRRSVLDIAIAGAGTGGLSADGRVGIVNGVRRCIASGWKIERVPRNVRAANAVGDRGS